MDWFFGWLLEAPTWQLLLAMTLAVILLILLVSSIIMGATKCGDENPATSPSESVRIAAVGREGTPSHTSVARNVNDVVTPKQFARTSQDVNGTKTGCSAKATSAASVTNQS